MGGRAGLVERPRRHDRPLLRRLDAVRRGRAAARRGSRRSSRAPAWRRCTSTSSRPACRTSCSGPARSRPTSRSRSSASCRRSADPTGLPHRRRLRQQRSRTPAAALPQVGARRRRGPALRALRRLAPRSATGRRGATAADIPVFLVHGVNDNAARVAALEWFTRRGGRAGDKLWLGQWDHGSGCCPNRRGIQWTVRAARLVRQAARPAQRGDRPAGRAVHVRRRPSRTRAPATAPRCSTEHGVARPARRRVTFYPTADGDARALRPTTAERLGVVHRRRRGFIGPRTTGGADVRAPPPLAQTTSCSPASRS